MDPSNLRCSFCSAHLDQDNGVLGPDVGICHSCANRAAERMESLLPVQELSTRRSGEIHCSFCDASSATTAILKGRSHCICSECVLLIRNDIMANPFVLTRPVPRGVYAL